MFGDPNYKLTKNQKILLTVLGVGVIIFILGFIVSDVLTVFFTWLFYEDNGGFFGWHIHHSVLLFVSLPFFYVAIKRWDNKDRLFWFMFAIAVFCFAAYVEDGVFWGNWITFATPIP